MSVEYFEKQQDEVFVDGQRDAESSCIDRTKTTETISLCDQPSSDDERGSKENVRCYQVLSIFGEKHILGLCRRFNSCIIV